MVSPVTLVPSFGFEHRVPKNPIGHHHFIKPSYLKNHLGVVTIFGQSVIFRTRRVDDEDEVFFFK